MVAGCGPTCVKYLFFTFNFLIFICGGGILGVSLWARFDANFQNTFQEALKTGNNQVALAAPIQNMHIALYVLAAIGGMLLLCGFLGCCGACCENTCLLGMFFVIILVLFLAEIAGGIYIFVKKDDMKEEMRTWFREAFIKPTSNEEVQNQLKALQIQANCCGASGCIDTDLLLNPAVTQCCAKTVLTGNAWPGCSDLMYDQLRKNVTIVAIVAVCLVVIELLAMIFSCILCNSIRNAEYYHY